MLLGIDRDEGQPQHSQRATASCDADTDRDGVRGHSDEPQGTDPVVLDEVVHQRHRLRILTHLDREGRSDFPTLKRSLNLTDGNLGRHLEILAEAGLVTIEKGFEGRRPRTWVELSSTGREALDAERRVLRQLIDLTDDAEAARHEAEAEADPAT